MNLAFGSQEWLTYWCLPFGVIHVYLSSCRVNPSQISSGTPLVPSSRWSSAFWQSGPLWKGPARQCLNQHWKVVLAEGDRRLSCMFYTQAHIAPNYRRHTPDQSPSFQGCLISREDGKQRFRCWTKWNGKYGLQNCQLLEKTSLGQLDELHSFPLLTRSRWRILARGESNIEGILLKSVFVVIWRVLTWVLWI